MRPCGPQPPPPYPVSSRGLLAESGPACAAGAIEGTGATQRRWTFLAGTAVEMLIISVILINVVYVLVDAQAWELADADGSAATEADEPSVRHFVAFEIFSALFFTVRAPPPLP